MQQLGSSSDGNLSFCVSLVCTFVRFVDPATVAFQLRLTVRVFAGFPGSHITDSGADSNSASNSACVHQQPECNTLPSNKLSDCFWGSSWRSGAQVNTLPGERREAPPPPGLIRPVVTDRRQSVRLT